MRKRLLCAAALALAFLAGSVTNSRVHAQSHGFELITTEIPKVPIEWGQFRAATHDYVIFEDNKGTLRMLYFTSGLQKYRQVDRLYPAQR